MPGRFEDIGFLWEQTLRNPVNLFRTANERPTLAIFDSKGFFLSTEAKEAYDLSVETGGRRGKLKDLPHLYCARTEAGNDYYFGISNQKGGRWKRSHAYHLRTLACDIIDTRRPERGDQDHAEWVTAWFDLNSLERGETNWVIEMRNPVLISFFAPQGKISRDELLAAESDLISEALRRNLRILNRNRGRASLRR